MGTAIATPIETLQHFIATNKDRIAASMPAGVRAELITRSLMGAMRQDPKVAACTPKSLITCLEAMTLTGLDVGHQLTAKAYIIPYGKEAKFQIGYKGIKELVRRSGQGTLIMQDVREGDAFEDNGSDTMPTFRAAKDPIRHRKKLEWVYAAFVPRDNSTPIVSVWSRERCIDHRDQHSKGYHGNKTDAWHEGNPSFPVMCQKCAVMELAGRGDLPLSPDVCQLADAADVMREIQPASVVALPTTEPPIAHGIEDQTPIEPDDTPADIDWTWFADHLGTVMTEKPLDDLCNQLMSQHPHQRQEIFDACEKHRELIREQAK